MKHGYNYEKISDKLDNLIQIKNNKNEELLHNINENIRKWNNKK